MTLIMALCNYAEKEPSNTVVVVSIVVPIAAAVLLISIIIFIVIAIKKMISKRNSIHDQSQNKPPAHTQEQI